MESALSSICAQHKILSLEKFETGETQSNYRAFGENGELQALRIFKSKAHAIKEIKVLEKCGNRILTPQILFSSLEEPPYILTTFLPGEHLGHILKNTDEVEQLTVAKSLGATLAKINSITFESEPSPDSPDFFEHIEKCLFEKQGNLILGEEKADLLWKKITKNKETLSKYIYRNQLVHGDFKCNNLLLTKSDGTWMVSGVLDWEFAFSGSPLYDISSFNKHIKRLLPAFGDSFFAAFLAEYKNNSAEDIPANWEEICMYLDLIMHCDALVTAIPGKRRHAAALEYLNNFLVKCS